MLQDKAADRLRHLHQGQDSGKCRGSCQNKEDRCECADGFHQNPPDITDVDAPVNKKADDYKDFATDKVTEKSSVYTDIVRSVIQSHSKDDISEELVKKEALQQIQKKFNTKAIVGITLTNFMYQ